MKLTAETQLIQRWDVGQNDFMLGKENSRRKQDV